MIDIDDTPNTRYPFRYVLSPRPTQASQTLPEFLNADAASSSTPPTLGKTMEVSPETHYYAQKISELLHQVGGAVLVMDYGEIGSSEASLRAIRDHQFVHLFESPGTCDLSANVDFQFLQTTFHQSQLQTYPVISQHDFLKACGIEFRVAQLLRSQRNHVSNLNVGNQEDWQQQAHRLVNAMGHIYKCCLATSNVEKEIPIGFSKDV
ncbi:hypothetical protein HMI55_003651 [Coelomomyces lativittatus]|nr:hypothetical protein HMI55_003651 [Coelomomyces lativittatus]